MGDSRFKEPYRRLAGAKDVTREIEQFRDDELIQVLAATTNEPLLGNIVASALLNRSRLKNATLAVAAEGLTALDADGRVKLMNPAAERILGWARGEIMGARLVDVVSVPGEPGHLDRCLDLGFTGASTRVDDDAFRRKDGHVVSVGYTLAPVMRDGAADGFVLVFRDVTDTRRLLQAYGRSEHDLKAAHVLARLGRWDWDAVRDVVTWSEELYPVFGLEPEEFDGTRATFLEFFPDADRSRFEARLGASASGEMEFGLTHSIRRRDGAMRTLRTHGALVLGVERKLLRAWGTMQDVTGWCTTDRA